MDPKACLTELRELSLSLYQRIDAGEPPDFDEVARFIDLFESLDGWMAGGGFSPWERSRRSATTAIGKSGSSASQTAI